MKKLAFVLGLVLSLAVGQAIAQAQHHEFSTFGQWARFKSGGTTTSVSILNLGYGYYFTPQLVGTLGITRVSASGFGATDVVIGGKYYFSIGRKGSLVPFVDGQIGTTKTDTSRDRRWQLGGGVSYFVSESTSFDAGLHWLRINTDPSTSGTIIGVVVGCALFMGLVGAFFLPPQMVQRRQPRGW